MTWGVVAGTVVSAGAGIYGAGQQADAAEEAAKQQQAGVGQGLTATEEATARANRLVRPFRDTGYEANSLMNYLMGFGTPEQLAKTEANFDADKYREFLVDRVTDRLSQKYANNPDKLNRVLARKVSEIDANLAKGAWKDYKSREGRGANIGGEFWKTRTVMPDGAGTDPNFGFLTQRFNNERFEKDPGYQFRMDEGNRALEGSAAARGGLLSGAAMKAMQKYSQGFASNEYGNAYNRFVTDQNNLYNRASGQQDMGMRAVGAQGGNLINQGQQANQAYSSLGDLRAAGVMGGQQARASGYSQAGNALMSGIGQWSANQRKNNLENTQDSGGVSWNPQTQSYE